jgi:Ca2+/Na+ antiporter
MKTSGLAGPITTAEQIWVVGTTLLATVLFFWRKFKSDGVTRVDGFLLLAWWIVLTFACMYAFMMGMGG